jgi:hypothetical protein
MLGCYELTHVQSTQASTDTPLLSSCYVHSKSQVQVKFAQVGIMYTYGQSYMYRQGSPFEIHIPKQWNMIRHSWNYCLSLLQLKKRYKANTATRIGITICADVGTGSNSLDFTGRFWSIVQGAEFLVRPASSGEKKTCLWKTYYEVKDRFLTPMTALSAVAVLR